MEAIVAWPTGSQHEEAEAGGSLEPRSLRPAWVIERPCLLNGKKGKEKTTAQALKTT
jgi:hypothetical protein